MRIEREKAPVIVTNGWVRTAYCVIESLGRRGIPVHVIDRSKYAMCRYSRWTKSFHQVPNYYTEPEAYVSAVAEIARQMGVCVLIPSHEDIIPLVNYRRLLPPELKFAHAPAEKLRLANDKWEVMKLCKNLGAAHAESFIPESLEELKKRAGELAYPAVIKTRVGNAGKGVIFVHDRDDLMTQYAAVLERFSILRENWPMVQEYLGTDICGVCMIYNKGRLVASSAETYLRTKEENKFSTTTYRRSAFDPEGVANCKMVADHLKWHGVIHFDMIRDFRTGTGKIIEINPRLWGTLIIAVAAGIDFPYMLYQLALTKKITSFSDTYAENVYARWILGELIGLLNLIKRKAPYHERLRELSGILFTPLKGATDDFRMSDPLPFVMEMADYFRRFRVTHSSNPAEDGMVR
jgi:predicted ATP-grasp superfamily ATP-dependent carboligase